MRDVAKFLAKTVGFLDQRFEYTFGRNLLLFKRKNARFVKTNGASMKLKTSVVALSCVALLASGCASNMSNNDYAHSAAMQELMARKRSSPGIACGS